MQIRRQIEAASLGFCHSSVLGLHAVQPNHTQPLRSPHLLSDPGEAAVRGVMGCLDALGLVMLSEVVFDIDAGLYTTTCQESNINDR
jgi:hypothetical protein